VFDRGTLEEDGPGTWEAPDLHTENKRSRCGRALARGIRAAAEGEGESEGWGVAMRTGNRMATEPGVAKSARVGTNFWRET